MAGRILVVDDEFLSRGNLCNYLSSEGYDVREVANGAEALEVTCRRDLRSCDHRLYYAERGWISTP
jgi:CheY-like chemotaxis protein